MPRTAHAVAGRQGDPSVLLRDHLIDAAEALLSGRQVAAITTRDLARAADVSEGVLYNYFADKNDLLLTALSRRFRELVADLQAIVPDPEHGTVRSNLVRFARGLFALHVTGLPLFGKLLTEPTLLVRFSHEIHRADAGLSGGDIRDAVIDYLESERHHGRIRKCDPAAAADLLLGSVALLALLHLTTGAEVERRIPGLVDTLIGGLRTEGKT
jgi:AcrR family transcriptional regulator